MVDSDIVLHSISGFEQLTRTASALRDPVSIPIIAQTQPHAGDLGEIPV